MSRDHVIIFWIWLTACAIFGGYVFEIGWLLGVGVMSLVVMVFMGIEVEDE
jgi:hypothetical protein